MGTAQRERQRTLAAHFLLVSAALFAAVVPQPARAGCSFGHQLACVFSESTCWPALVSSRESFDQCVNKLSKGYCTPCLDGEGDPHDPTGVPGEVDGSNAQFSLVRPTLASPVVGPNLDGHFEVAAVGRTGVLFHLWQANGAWAGPADFPSSPHVSSVPTVVQRGIGPLDVFGVMPDGTVGHVRQLAPNVNWGGWQSLGGHMTGSIAAVLQTLGTTVLVAAGQDGQVYYARDPDLTTWKSLGGDAAGSPTVATNFDGRLEVFATSSKGVLRHIWELSPGGAWSQWADLGPSVKPDPVAVSNQDGRIAVFVSTTASVLRIFEQQTVNGGWAPPVDLVGTHRGGPSAIINQNGKLEVFVVGANDGAVYHAVQHSPGKKFGAWSTLGGTLTSSPVATKTTSGVVTLFGSGADEAVWTTQQKKAGSKDWTGWVRVGGTVNPQLF